MISEQEVIEHLEDIVDPCSAATGSNLNIVEMGLVKSIDIDVDVAVFDMRLTTPACNMIAYFIKEIDTRVGSHPNVDSVTLQTDYGLEWTEDMMPIEAKAKRQAIFEEQEARYREEMKIE